MLLLHQKRTTESVCGGEEQRDTQRHRTTKHQFLLIFNPASFQTCNDLLILLSGKKKNHRTLKLKTSFLGPYLAVTFFFFFFTFPNSIIKSPTLTMSIQFTPSTTQPDIIRSIKILNRQFQVAYHIRVFFGTKEAYGNLQKSTVRLMIYLLETLAHLGYIGVSDLKFKDSQLCGENELKWNYP